nr:hypothetical protein Iba_chr14cCG1060 [Ipomoea batatas]GMD93270.1 hypothetical protein Iba_chr14fCG5810 [Ipomoea batatas]GME15001.1 hypothetical protein Iba_scaffold15705CG0010 [Ipomoea batatas]GME19963.1 hypothetical protein Iba_scaffold24169CG0010 [Ipomoea batatas]
MNNTIRNGGAPHTLMEFHLQELMKSHRDLCFLLLSLQKCVH